MQHTYSIFTKPWRELSVAELGRLVSGLGFNAVEFPLRDGYQLEPANAEKGLKQLAAELGEFGVKISSVASSTTEHVFAGCQNAGVRILRIMAGCDRKLGFMKSVDNIRRELDAILPLCEKYNVTLGVQQHYGFSVFNTMELRYLLDGYDPQYIAAIWDAAHSMLAGELPEQALDIIYDKLCLVNFKAAYPRRINGPEAAGAKFEPYFTTGINGAMSWKLAVECLQARNWQGDICMPAEYTDTRNVEPYIARDVVYLKSLFGE